MDLEQTKEQIIESNNAKIFEKFKGNFYTLDIGLSNKKNNYQRTKKRVKLVGYHKELKNFMIGVSVDGTSGFTNKCKNEYIENYDKNDKKQYVIFHARFIHTIYDTDRIKVKEKRVKKEKKNF